MCLLCIEVAKEAVRPKDFWRNYREVSEEHMPELIKTVSNTSIDYQLELANGVGEAYEDD
jgi:hypothetical protein